MSRTDVTLEDVYLYECGYYKTKDGTIKKIPKEEMSHKAILKTAAKKLSADAKSYSKEAKEEKKKGHKAKAKHELLEMKEAKSAAKSIKKKAAKAHE